MDTLLDLALNLAATVADVKSALTQCEREPYVEAAVEYHAGTNPYVTMKTYGGIFDIYGDESGYRISSPYDYGAQHAAYTRLGDVLDFILTELFEDIAESMTLEAADVLAGAEYVILSDDWGGDLSPYVIFNTKYDIWDDLALPAFTVFVDVSDDYPLLSVRWQVPDTVRGLLRRADDMCIGTDYGFAETFDSGVSEKIAGALGNDSV